MSPQEKMTPQDTIHFAFIGCGKIAFRHLDAIQQTPNARIVSVCDADGGRAQALSDAAHVAWYTNYHEMLQQHPEIDVVTLLTPSGLHFEQALDIIQHYRKHLVIEKPLVLRLEHAALLKQRAENHNLAIFPVYQHRFNKAIQTVKGALGDNRALGQLRVGTVRVRWCRPDRYYNLSAWRGTWAMDGGALTNQGIHFIDLLRYLGGEVKAVHAKCATLGAKIEVEDTAVAILEFESGALGVIEVMTSARPDDFEASISCVCANGLAVISGAATNILQTYTPDPQQEQLASENFPTTYGFGHNQVIQGIVQHLREQKPAAITFDDGITTIQLLHALYRSDEVGGWVNVNDNIESARLGIAQHEKANLRSINLAN